MTAEEREATKTMAKHVLDSLCCEHMVPADIVDELQDRVGYVMAALDKRDTVTGHLHEAFYNLAVEELNKISLTLSLMGVE